VRGPSFLRLTASFADRITANILRTPPCMIFRIHLRSRYRARLFCYWSPAEFRSAPIRESNGTCASEFRYI
jgi:hypothetical protein